MVGSYISPSVRLFVRLCKSLEKKNSLDKMSIEMGWGQRSRVSRSKLKWVNDIELMIWVDDIGRWAHVNVNLLHYLP